jgi:effector-binding domain-containing protein
MIDSPIFYKKLESTMIAFIKTRVDSREEIPVLFERLRAVCGEFINGDALVIFHGGAVKDGFLIEAAFPVTHPVEADVNHPMGEIHTRILEAAPALTMTHYGSHQTIRKTVLKVYEYMGKHAWTTSLFWREMYRVLDPAAPEKDVTEVQIILHEWDRLLAEGAEKVLGAEARRMLMQGIGSITPSSSFDDYTTWIQGAIERLDALTDDDEIKCRVVSHCAHVFPQERIDHLRAIYERGEFDDILREMYTDDFWYEEPVRRGNVLYMRKNPFNPEGYANAATPAERRKAYCHCPFVHPYLDEIPAKLSLTFCFCGAGWYRRLWEGILGRPVMIEHVETLLKGHDQCTLTITLPLELAGECSPENEKV